MSRQPFHLTPTVTVTVVAFSYLLFLLFLPAFPILMMNLVPVALHSAFALDPDLELSSTS